MKLLITAVLFFILGVGAGHYGSTQFISEKETVDPTVTEATRVYSNDEYGFSLTYPRTLEVETFQEASGRTLVFQEPDTTTGFQVYITPFGGKQITEDRILQDIESGVIRDPTEIVLPQNTQGLVFWSEAPVIGESREIWFVKNGFLFQVTTYADLDPWISEILSTLTFE